MFRPLFPSFKNYSKVCKDEDEQIDEEYKYYFESKFTESNNPLYTLFINNNLPLDQGMFLSSQVVCDHC